jgi:hypothetical protein
MKIHNAFIAERRPGVQYHVPKAGRRFLGEELNDAYFRAPGRRLKALLADTR